MKKKKIIRVIARLNIGGPAIHVILLAEGLNSEKYETLLLSGKEAPEEGNMHDLAQRKGVEFTVIENLGRELHVIRDFSTLWKLFWLFKKEKPDIVHTHTAKAGTVGRIAARLAGVPVIVHTFHGHVLHGYFQSWKTEFFRVIECFLAKFCSSKIIAVSECCRQDLIEYKIGRDDHIRMIPLGLELDRFRESQPDVRSQLREEWQVPQNGFLIGMIARMVPIKRHEDLFHAIAMVLRDYPDTYFAIVGDGERRRDLETLANELGIRHRTMFTGFRDDTERVYQAIDLTVLTSGNEGLPVTIIESLSAGKPVVATRVGGVPELVEDGKTGFIVEPRNPQSIADGLKKALADIEKTKGMGKQAQEETIAKFSSRRLIRDMETLYEELSVR
ncbi:glycosyltransferase [bacterium]|nr:glycosyltransferase [bacterium]